MNTEDAIQARRTENLVMLVNVALSVLSQRTLTIIHLLLTTGIFAWAMYSESYPRLLGAALFAIASWCAVHLRPKGANHET